MSTCDPYNPNTITFADDINILDANNDLDNDVYNEAMPQTLPLFNDYVNTIDPII
jgi:hypothetical protein